MLSTEDGNLQKGELNRMKKLFALLLTLCMVLALAACGSTAAPAATQAPATQAPATEAPATQAPATEAPATQAPATEAPATQAPATEAPATKAPATEAPATKAPVTEAPVEATEEPAEAALEPMSYADYAAAEVDDPVCVICYAQAHQSWWDGKVTVYAADEDGAYFLYNMACSEEDAAKLVDGAKIQVTGYKGEWAGEVEIVDATFEFVDGDPYVAEPVDVTEQLGTDALVDYQNRLVSLKGLTVEPYDEEGAAFQYKDPDGKTDDLYFKVSKDGKTFEFCVEFYLCGKDTPVYQAVEALEVGQVVDLEGFLYWYEGANLHTTGLTVVD